MHQQAAHPRLRQPVLVALLLTAGGLTSCEGDAPDVTPGDIDAAIAAQTGVPGAGALQAANPSNPARPLFHDFGEMIWGSEEIHSTRFLNIGSAPVTIKSAQAACGCTRMISLTSFGEDGKKIDEVNTARNGQLITVPVGGAVEMDVRLLTSFSKANQRKLAIFRLTTDSYTTPYISMEYSFLPMRPFDMAPSEFRMLSVPVSHGAETRLKVLTPSPGQPARVLGVLSAPEGVEVSVTPEIFAGEEFWYVDAKIPPMSPLGPIRGKVRLKTTDMDGNGEDGVLDIPFLALVTPDVWASPGLVTFRNFDAKLGAESTGRLVALVPGARIRVTGSRFEANDPDRYEVQLTPVKPNARGRAIEYEYVVRVKPGGVAGYVGGEIVFEMDEPFGGAANDPLKVVDGQGNELRLRMSGVAQTEVVTGAKN